MLALLEAHGLRVERDDRLLFSHLNLAVQAGELLHIKGVNGAGKTTLLRVLAGLFAAHEGSILWKGKPLASVYDDYLNHLLYIGHKIGIKSSLTPFENLKWYAQLHGDVSPQKIMDALDRVGLRGFDDVLCQHLSEGQKRRVALARLTFTRAPLWILDEPFSAIDQQGVEQLEALLVEHTKQNGTVIFTTHQALLTPHVRVIQLEPVHEYH